MDAHLSWNNAEDEYNFTDVDDQRPITSPSYHHPSASSDSESTEGTNDEERDSRDISEEPSVSDGYSSDSDLQRIQDIRLEQPSGNPGKGYDRGYSIRSRSDWNPWYPFKDSFDFNSARTLTLKNLTNSAIDALFSQGLLPTPKLSFGSARALHLKLNQLAIDMGEPSWSIGREALADKTIATFKYRNPIDLIEYLLSQRVYKDDLVYSPVREFRDDARLYSELHTADWWWNTQLSLPREDGTVVPVILGSDATHLTQFSGGKKAWPIYLTIGNILSSVRNKPSSCAIMLLALLPISASAMANRDVIHRILTHILSPLNQYSSSGLWVTCADLLDRICYPRIVGWIADHKENCLLYHIKNNLCPVCEIDHGNMGSGEIGASRDYLLYQRYYNNGEQSELDAVNVHPIPASLFWSINFLSNPLPWKPDLLHILFLGLFKHLMEWLEDFLKHHGRFKRFNYLWKSIEPYPNIHTPTKCYNEISQWQGREMRSFSRIIHACLAASLSHPSPTAGSSQKRLFTKAISCTSALVDFSLIASYKSHDEETLKYLDEYLQAFHTHKDIFLQFRANRSARAAADAAGKETRRVLAGQQAIDRSPRLNKRRRTAEEIHMEILEQRQAVLEEMSDFNFPKLHMLSHFSDSIKLFGSLPMWSTESMEAAHKYQVKDGYRASNKGKTYEEQFIKYHTKRQTVRIHHLNLVAYAKDGYYTSGTADALNLLDTKRRRIRNKAYKTHDNAQIQQIQGWIPSFPSPPNLSKRVLRNRVYVGESGRRIFTVADVEQYYNLPFLSFHIRKYFQRLLNQGEVAPLGSLASIQQLEVELFKKVSIPLQRIDEGVDTHEVCASGPTLYYGRYRSDWVWYMPSSAEDHYGVLRGKLPSRALAFMKVHWQNLTYRLAYIRRSMALHGGQLHPWYQLPTVTYLDNTEPEINTIRSLFGRACLVPVSPTRWIVNTRIDLITFNSFYW
jgi:hypothetical protein